MDKILVDAWDSLRGFSVETDEHDEAVKYINARVATLDVVNLNNRIIPSGILGDKTLYVAMSDYEHNSVKPQGGMFASQGTAFPVTESLLSEKGDALWTRTRFDTKDDFEKSQFLRLNRVRRVIGFSVAYYARKSEMVTVPNRSRKAEKVKEADFVEFTPTMSPASPGTRVHAIDSLDSYDSDEVKRILTLFSDEDVQAEFQRRADIASQLSMDTQQQEEALAVLDLYRR